MCTPFDSEQKPLENRSLPECYPLFVFSYNGESKRKGTFVLTKITDGVPDQEEADLTRLESGRPKAIQKRVANGSLLTLIGKGDNKINPQE